MLHIRLVARVTNINDGKPFFLKVTTVWGCSRPVLHVKTVNIDRQEAESIRFRYKLLIKFSIEAEIISVLLYKKDCLTFRLEFMNVLRGRFRCRHKAYRRILRRNTPFYLKALDKANSSIIYLCLAMNHMFVPAESGVCTEVTHPSSSLPCVLLVSAPRMMYCCLFHNGYPARFVRPSHALRLIRLTVET